MPRVFFISILMGIAGCCTKPKTVEQVPQPPATACDNCGKENPLIGLGQSLPTTNAESETPATKTPSRIGFKPVYFKFNSASLTTEAIDHLKEISEELKLRGVTEITLAGHCDERGTKIYNYELSRRRVNVVAMILNQALGGAVHNYRVFAIGEDEPYCPKYTEACWALNRRVEISAVMP